jgi:hypothetical protein
LLAASISGLFGEVIFFGLEKTRIMTSEVGWNSMTREIHVHS